MKACTTCGNTKPLEDFPPDHRARDKRQTKCRLCINAWMKAHYRKNPAEQMLRRARARAAGQGFECDISVDEILPLPEFCPVFGTPMRLTAQQHDPNAYSLDRKDNAKGYVKGNVAVMSYRANRLKNDGSADDHEAIARWMRSQGLD